MEHRRDDETLITEFTTYLRSRDLNEGTVRQYPQHVKYLSEFVGGNLLSVDEDALSRFSVHLRERNLSETTINRYFVGLATPPRQPQGVLWGIKASQVVHASRIEDTGDEYIQKVLICMDHIRVRSGIKLNSKLVYNEIVAS